MRCGRNLARALLEYYQVMGIIPVEVAAVPKKRKQRRRPRSISPNSYRQRPHTSRTSALLHFKDLNIYDSETSGDEQPLYSYRNVYTPNKYVEIFNERKSVLEERYKKQSKGVCFVSPPPTPLIVMPQPSLSVIDFNLMTRNAIMNAAERK